MLRIGQFARIAQVSVKTLRHYHSIGLLRPAEVDRSSGYRYYQPQQLRRLSRILVLRKMGLSLESVRELLDEDVPTSDMRRRLILRRRELERSISQQIEQLADVDACLKAFEQGCARGHTEVLVKRTAPRRVASLRSRLKSYQEAGELFSELEGRLGPAVRRSSPGAIWHRCAHEGTIDCEAFVPIPEGVCAPRGVRVHDLAVQRVASILHYGPDETSENTYAAARKWIAARGRRVSGPNHEIYLCQGRDGEENDVTEIQFPID